MNDFLRQCIKMTVASFDKPFTVTQVLSSMNGLYEFGDIDVSKAVSNELQRMQKLRLLESRPGVKGDDPNLQGRPPRVFTKIYCQQSLDVIGRRTVVDKGCE
jgi:hypothetical protein